MPTNPNPFLDIQRRTPITAPHHGWLTSPARSHANVGQGSELPLHLIALILSHLDNVADLARITRTSRLFYYMTLPRLYEEVTLRSYSEIRYVNGRPEGYGNGSPFAMGLNTLVSRTFTDYVQTFRVIGDWREHDIEDYSKGRVPDNSMMLQVAMRAALDKMKNLQTFAWELNTKPMQTIYQGIMTKPSLTSLTLRCQTKRIPRPTALIPPLPNLKTLIVYDMDPLCYPDDISLLLLTSKKLENLMLHWSPRMRESGEESVNLMNYFGRCLAARYAVPAKRLALYNLYARNTGEGFENCLDASSGEEITVINCMGSSDPMTVFLDDTWRVNSNHKIPERLKMMRGDIVDKEHVTMLAKFHGLERLYLLSRRKTSRGSSTAATPTTPSVSTPSNCTSTNGAPFTEHQCKSLAGDYLAIIASNHRTMRHLLLLDNWQLSDGALLKLCQSCPDLEQLGFSSGVPPLGFLRQCLSLVPKLWALRVLIRPGSDLAEKLDSIEFEMHQFALATELWRPEYKNLRYFGLGDKYTFKLGGVVFPPKGSQANIPDGQANSMNARKMGPIRVMRRIEREDVKHVEIWCMDSTEFEPKFP
ncbi:uncharacterized protein BDR25DRAFT_213858 [Lindgomyces ingoldianus]|uniref:Uncharacterized protein n=1 Tax=Lindgomyces ingoldianus TaxID=673940 RepID=A0ACB6R7J4_9PLEO|nr:uncharacterized protein BDR25DRAFT_213858 [Lindgomyces ingoldianus]KAF2475156.1 hypothetical protein BDR25DRAFT_213858 [Lindgomyces ingoldianus]